MTRHRFKRLERRNNSHSHLCRYGNPQSVDFFSHHLLDIGTIEPLFDFVLDVHRVSGSTLNDLKRKTPVATEMGITSSLSIHWLSTDHNVNRPTSWMRPSVYSRYLLIHPIAALCAHAWPIAYRRGRFLLRGGAQ